MPLLKDVYTLEDLQNWDQATEGIAPPIRLAVIGDPIAHSASPFMQNAALAACGIPAAYTRLHLHAEELAPALPLLALNGFVGANVTIPHKVSIMGLLDHVDDHARKIGAVNTLLIEKGGEGGKGKLSGFNTDGPGLVRAIHADFGVDVRDLRILVLGAGGGAGRAIAVQCAMEGCERLVLVNRTLEKSRQLAGELAPYFKGPHVNGPLARLAAIPWEESALKEQLNQIDLVINATSLGMKRGDLSPLPSPLILPHLLVYDAIYSAERTQLMRAADEAGARCANGFSMLLHQGALAFEIWFNRAAPLEVMRTALLKK